MLKGKIKDRSDLKVWVNYRDGFEVEIRHTPRGHSVDIAQRCQKQEWDVASGSYATVLDKDKFYDVLSREVVTDWRGLTPDVLCSLADMSEYPESDVPYSPEDAAELLTKVAGFDMWAQNIARNLDHYVTKKKADEIKNS